MSEIAQVLFTECQHIDPMASRLTVLEQQNVQESQAEDAKKDVFLLPAKLQFRQHGQRQDKDGKVCCDVSGGINVPER